MTQGSGAHADRVSPETRQLVADVAAQLGTVRPVRDDLTGRLRREVASGHYAPPVEQVAARLVGPLLSRQPRVTRWR